MGLQTEFNRELKNYLMNADPILMNEVLMFAICKLYPDLCEQERMELSRCHRLLSAISKQKQLEQLTKTG